MSVAEESLHSTDIVTVFRQRVGTKSPLNLRRKNTPNAQRPTSNADYAGAPPRAPGSGGVTSGAATTCLGGFSAGIFLPGGGLAPGGGLIRRPCSTISLSCEPSSVSNSSSAFAVGVFVFFRQPHGRSKGWSARDNGDFVQGFGVREKFEQQRVTRFVVSGVLLFFFAQREAPALFAPTNFVARFFELGERDAL